MTSRGANARIRVEATPPETRMAIERARQGLRDAGVVRPTQEQVAERLGVSARTVRRWEADVR